MRKLALSWEDHRRTRELCVGLDLDLIVLRTRARGFTRYALLSARTLWLLLRRRVEVLLVQNPSLVLAALTVLLKSVLGFRLVVDAHNEAVDPFINPQRWIRRLAHWVIRHSDLTIVTNRQLAQQVHACGGAAFVLPDRVPVPPASAQRHALPAGFNLVLIATYARDEPIAAIFEAVRDTDVRLHVTGNPAKLDATVAARVPSNVAFTGFLAEQDYWGLLSAADAVIDLTLMDNCVVCGAYEALALGKPMILSGNRASIELFGEAAVYTDNSAADIRRAITTLRQQLLHCEAVAKQTRSDMEVQWNVRAQELARTLAQPAAGATVMGG